MLKNIPLDEQTEYIGTPILPGENYWHCGLLYKVIEVKIYKGAIILTLEYENDILNNILYKG